MESDLGLIWHLEKRREEAGVTRETLSLEAGYPSMYWQEVISADKPCSLAAFAAHADALGYKFVLYGK